MSRKIESVVTDLIFKHTTKEDYKIAQFYEKKFSQQRQNLNKIL
ncbi:hypothetical protein CUPS4258_08005 [Campylobacter upsaliensis]|nr:hypothetical protein [Campylobacter upsaliensis]